MSDPKECNWCRQRKTPAEGRWDNGRWICFECFPDNTILLNKPQKCIVCSKKSNQGVLDGKKFICTICSPSQRKFGKKQKWSDPHESEAKRQRKAKAKQRKRHHHEEIEAARREAEIKTRVRWKVVIEEISTGDL